VLGLKPRASHIIGQHSILSPNILSPNIFILMTEGD
jgi:hypothetical protein